MRVVFVVRAPFLSGAERSLQLLIEHLPPLEVEPAVVAAIGSALRPWCEAKGIPYAECLLASRDKWHPLRWWRSVRQVRAALRSFGARLVHSNQLWSYPPTGAAGLDLGIPRVCHMRDEATPEAVSWWCATGVEGVVTVSRHIADLVRPAWPEGKARPIIETLMGPAPLAPLPDAQERRQRQSVARRQFGLADEGVLLGFIGQVVPIKGLLELFEALEGLTGVGRWQLAVAGRDPRPGAPHEAVCRDRVRRLGLGERVKFLGFQDDVQPFYQAIDVVVVPSLEEPLGRVPLEAAAHAKPAIAFATGGLPETIRDGQTGWLVPTGDVAGLRQCLRNFLEHPATEAGLAARAWVETIADPAAYAAKLIGLYQRLLRPSHEASPAPAAVGVIQ